jgi:hypothetical protein
VADESLKGAYLTERPPTAEIMRRIVRDTQPGDRAHDFAVAWLDRYGDDPCIHGPGVASCGHPDCTGARP